MVSDNKISDIRKEAKGILDRFSTELGKVSIGKGKKLKRKVEGFRDEDSKDETTTFGKGSRSPKEDSYFREILFENAPSKEGDCIVAESKKW
jgi:hypothetical protein